ncbi:MAG: hypothetical protein Ta2A_11150 [Treponemataceae bacterium]|nr:MAG: hypothetical protein Ta2A_11150 [Treponemataceae bacterium]
MTDKLTEQEIAELFNKNGLTAPHVHTLPVNEKFSFTALLKGFLQSEKLVAIFFMFSLFRDNFRTEFGENAYKVWMVHAAVLVICIFAGVIKKRVVTSDITIKRNGTEVSLGGRDGKVS